MYKLLVAVRCDLCAFFILDMNLRSACHASRPIDTKSKTLNNAPIFLTSLLHYTAFNNVFSKAQKMCMCTARVGTYKIFCKQINVMLNISFKYAMESQSVLLASSLRRVLYVCLLLVCLSHQIKCKKIRVHNK